jgi:hypothetical protein
MANLFWKNEHADLSLLTHQPFKTEEELEDYLYRTPQLLGDLIVISRQTKSGTHRDIPDLIAMDGDGNVVIIELKRASATEDVIPQVLRYAIWAETNPDAIKNLWLESPQKPDDRIIDWDALKVRIMVIAEEVPVNVLQPGNRISYSVEFIEVSRFISKGNEFVLVSSQTPEEIPSVTTARGKQSWDESWYRQNFNSASVDAFMKTVATVESIIKSKGWNLVSKFNKSYVSFRYGFPVVFGVMWTGAKSFCLYFKLSQEQAEAVRVEGIAPLRYEEAWNQVLYKVDSKDYPIAKFLPLFEAAYQNITGNK